MPKSSVWPAMPRLIVMSTTGPVLSALALLPWALTVTPCERSALAVGSVILLVSPWICKPKSAVNAALFTVAILASLSLTIWSADWPDAAIAATGLPLVDAVLLPPQPATKTAPSASASTRSSTTPRMDLARMWILPVDFRARENARGPVLGSPDLLLYRRMPGRRQP